MFTSDASNEAAMRYRSATNDGKEFSSIFQSFPVFLGKLRKQQRM
jgi:hypothetical protein